MKAPRPNVLPVHDLSCLSVAQRAEVALPSTCTAAVLTVSGRSAYEIFGPPDDVKFRSSMTLFGRADPAIPEFAKALAVFFEGKEDPGTLAQLSAT